MIRVLIVDSDAESVKNFQTYIKMSFPEIKSISVFGDHSKDVMSVVKTTAPHLILADIRFFGVGGYQVIRNIYERYPDIRFILYGTYNELDYMRRSLEFGVLDYLFRPIKPADFHRSFKEALDFFKKDGERKRKHEELVGRYKEKSDYFETVFVSSLIGGHIINENEIMNSFQYFNIDLPPGYTVFVLRVDHYRKIILTLEEMEKQLLSFKILSVLESKLKSCKSRIHMDTLNRVTVILGGGMSAENIITLCDGILEAVYEETSIRATIGVGRTYGKAADISVSYHEAQGALRYRFLMGYNTVIHINFVEPNNNITYRYPLDKEERLVYSAAIGEYEYCKVLLRDMFDALSEAAPISKRMISNIIMDILISMNRYLDEQNIELQPQLSSFFPAKELLQLENLDDAYVFMNDALKNFCEYVLSATDARNAKIVGEIKMHLNEKYYHGFSISKLALMVGTTPDYLNRIFERAEGQTVLDYLVGVRMNEAKRLMRETVADDEMIAVRVGYEDAKHFRGVFKQKEGLGTAEYRKQYNMFQVK